MRSCHSDMVSREKSTSYGVTGQNSCFRLRGYKLTYWESKYIRHKTIGVFDVSDVGSDLVAGVLRVLRGD